MPRPTVQVVRCGLQCRRTRHFDKHRPVGRRWSFSAHVMRGNSIWQNRRLESLMPPRHLSCWNWPFWDLERSRWSLFDRSLVPSMDDGGFYNPVAHPVGPSCCSYSSLPVCQHERWSRIIFIRSFCSSRRDRPIRRHRSDGSTRTVST